MTEENPSDNLTTEQTDKLVQFQEITSIDSIEECKHLLEASNWNIELAVQNALGDPIDNNLTNEEIPNTNDLLREAEQSQQNILNQIRNYSTNSSKNLPTVNILTQRTFSYYNPDVIPRGVFQWGYFLVAFPFRYLYSTLLNIVSTFWSFIGKNNSITNNENNNYDPLANIAEFAIEYNKQFGVNNHPSFYEGSYAQVVNQAKRDFRFVLVYIHENDNVDCMKFATETLGNQEVINFINNNLLFWACSKNLPEGKKVFNALKARRCPFLGLIVMRNNKMTLVAKLEGPIVHNELLVQLNHFIEDYQAELVTARIDRETYSQTQRLREQQDQAYAESLRLDQEKARKQRESEEAKKRALEEEKRQTEENKRKENEIVIRKAELKKKFEEEIIDATNPNAIKLLFKLPDGQRLERIFLKTDQIKNVYNFVFCNDACPTNFEIVTNFPRKVIECSHESVKTLEESGINQPMLLFINDLDA